MGSARPEAANDDENVALWMYRMVVKPRPLGCLLLLGLFLVASLLKAVNEAAGLALFSREEAGSSLTLNWVGAISTLVVTTLLIVALLTPSWRRAAPHIYAFVGLGWHVLAGFAVWMLVTTITDTAQNEPTLFKLGTIVLVALSALVITFTVNYCIYRMQTDASPPSEAVAFVVTTQTLLAVAVAVAGIAMLEGRFGMLANEVLTAGATGLTVLGIPASVAVFVTMRRHDLAGPAAGHVVAGGVSSTVESSSADAPSTLTPGAVGILLLGVAALLLSRRGSKRP